MLNLVFGRSGTGKTEYVFNSIKNDVNNGFSDILLITPEQFSLVSEKRLLTQLSEHGMSCVDNSSFTRICDAVADKYGKDNLPVLSKGSKAVLMMEAIESVKNNLTLFNKKLDSLTFVNSMVKIYDEMKSCNLGSYEIESLSKGIDNETLYRKLTDIARIIRSYEDIIDNRYLDSSNELTRLYNRIKDKNYFADKIVYIDGFNGFVAQEYKILELIIKEAKCVTITLCTDNADDDNYSLFTYVNNSAKIIKKIAYKSNVKIKERILKTNYRAKKSDLLAVESNIFSDDFDRVTSKCDNVSVYSAKNITDECCELARQIRTLLRNGYKAKDITIITRDLDKYRDELTTTLKKYEIPFFNDERQPIKCQPLVVFIEYLFRCVNYSFRSDDILSLAKTGLTDIADEEINLLENYIYLWNINGLKWTKDFEGSTKGFVSEITDSDKAELSRINDIRKRLITPIARFKKQIKNANALKICEEIYNTLIIFTADKIIKNNAVELYNSNHSALAFQQGEVWDMVMNILGTLPEILGNTPVSIKDFSKIFSMVISTEDLGSIPIGIDNVQIGQADRIRTDNPKFVFILGANEGEFPKTVSGGGLLSENDRRIMLENDFKLYSYGEILALQERYFAYMACAAPEERLFVSYIGSNGKDGAPSEIVSSLNSIFSELKNDNISSRSDIDLIETEKNSFELMSENYLVNKEFYSSLKKYFENSNKFNAVKSLAENIQSTIEDKTISTSLFDYNMYISASRLEDFYNCSFKYFCKFGLNARPRTKAEIDPMKRGTIIHYVLEMILSAYGSKNLSHMTENEIIKIVDKFIDDYFQTQMGNVSDVTVRFKYNYNRLSKLIYSVVIHLAQEFKCCDFEATAFELGIDKDGLVKPEVLKLDDGGTIQIRGSIDRVDTLEKNGEKFVRVVDYKSGNKQFNLSDIMYGLNLQMFVYLFSIWEDKNSRFYGTPAGVLYMHSSRNMFSFDSKKDADSKLSGEESASFKMKGIVLSDDNGEIAMAMEHDLEGKYIPVKIKKNGEITGELASLEELGLIHKKINALVAQMGMDLHMGKIYRNPVKNKTHDCICDYCDYSDVCASVKTVENRVLDDLSNDRVKEILREEYGDNA